MKEYEKSKDNVAMVAEPMQPYAVRENVSKPGRMTVNEYFDEVWQRVVKKHESL